jgi:adenylate kinase
VAQAEALDAELAREGRAVKLVLYLAVPEAVLIDRLTHRWTCPRDGVTYDYRVNPPRVLGVCDNDGAGLYQRDDDRPEIVTERIRIYVRDTEPVAAYYRARGVLREVDGTRDIQTVAADLAHWIEQAA